jgi:hypothetical protein
VTGFIRLDLVAEGRTGSIVIRNGDKPFRTVRAAPTTQTYGLVKDSLKHWPTRASYVAAEGADAIWQHGATWSRVS